MVGGRGRGAVAREGRYHTAGMAGVAGAAGVAGRGRRGRCVMARNAGQLNHAFPCQSMHMICATGLVT